MTFNAFWTPRQITGITSGRWVVPPSDPIARGTASRLSGLSIDTRTLQRGQVYLAIRGERFDGHDFVEQAFEAGAGMAIVAEGGWPPVEAGGQAGREHSGGAVLAVHDTVAALQQLARAYRDVLREAACRVIAVGGSNGKTTTRHLIHQVLRGGGLRGTQSPRSFNNHLGVPLTLLAADPGDDFVVVEIGSNHPGEVAALGAIARPDAAVITSIGHEHMEHFGTLDAVAAEEFSLLQYVRAGGEGLAVVPAGEAWPDASQTRKGDAGKGDAGEAPDRMATAVKHVKRVTFEADSAVPGPARFPLAGAHNRRNAAAACAVGRWMGLGDVVISRALEDVRPMAGRLEVVRHGSVRVIQDAYNANPESMRAALEVLMDCSPRGCGEVAGDEHEPVAHNHVGDPCGDPLNQEKRRRVAILGDMLELGEQAADLHRGVGRFIIEQVDAGGGIDMLITIGPLAARIAEPFTDDSRVIVHPITSWSDTLPAQVAALLRPRDVVLLKASRGMRLERLIPAIEAVFAAEPRPDEPRP